MSTTYIYKSKIVPTVKLFTMAQNYSNFLCVSFVIRKTVLSLRMEVARPNFWESPGRSPESCLLLIAVCTFTEHPLCTGSLRTLMCLFLCLSHHHQSMKGASINLPRIHSIQHTGTQMGFCTPSGISKVSVPSLYLIGLSTDTINQFSPNQEEKGRFHGR